MIELRMVGPEGESIYDVVAICDFCRAEIRDHRDGVYFYQPDPTGKSYLPIHGSLRLTHKRCCEDYHIRHDWIDAVRIELRDLVASLAFSLGMDRNRGPEGAYFSFTARR